MRLDSIFRDSIPQVKKLMEYKDAIIALPFVLYVLGFLITNLHLGSIGVVTFDLFRVRYIVVGALFAVFMATLIIALRGLLPKVVSEQSPPRRVLSGIFYSFSVYGTISIIVWILRPLSGSRYSPAIVLPDRTTSTTFVDALLGNPDQWSVAALRAVGIVVAIYTSLVILAVLVGPMIIKKEKITRKRILIGGLKGYLYLLLIVALIGLALAISRYITELREQRSIGQPRQSANDWTGFVAVHMAVYTLAAIHITLSSLGPLGAEKDENVHIENDPRRQLSYHFSFTFMTFLLISGTLIPAYALSAYPGIPQQLGGGAVIPAKIVTAWDTSISEDDFCDAPTYLLDRSSRSILVVRFSPRTEDLEAYEFMNSEIRSIQYYPTCPGSSH